MKKLLLLQFIVLLLSSCAHQGQHARATPIEGRLNQLTEKEASAMLGEPAEKVSLTPGVSVWTYRGKAEGGECTVSLVVSDGIVSSSKVLSKGLSLKSYMYGACANLLSGLQ